jgi:Cdc6-like AAA superfamily ATPase
MLCKTLALSEPNNTLINVLKVAKPSKKKPLILLFDEVDNMICDIHTGNIDLNKKIPTLVYNKRTYNQFFDDMFLVSFVIIIMTSNRTKEEIDELDTSYLRKGRVNLHFSL